MQVWKAPKVKTMECLVRIHVAAHFIGKKSSSELDINHEVSSSYASGDNANRLRRIGGVATSLGFRLGTYDLAGLGCKMRNWGRKNWSCTNRERVPIFRLLGCQASDLPRG
jgi:hypothetical protein